MSSPRPEKGTSADTTNVNYLLPATTPTSASAENSHVNWMSLILRSLTCIVMVYDLITLVICTFFNQILFPTYCVLSSLAACCLVTMIVHALYNHIRGYPITHGAEWHFSLWELYTTCVVSAMIFFHIFHGTNVWRAIFFIPLTVAVAIFLFIGISNLCTGYACRQNEVYMLLANLLQAVELKRLPAVRLFLSGLQTVAHSFSRMWPSPYSARFDCDNDLEVKKGPMEFV